MAAPLTAQIKTLTKGKFSAYQAKSPRDIAAAQQLRARCFGCQQPHDCDAFDAISTHVLIKEVSSNTVVCCFRLFAVNGRDLASSYAAQFYELSALQRYKGLMMEMGRFCVHPDWCDPDILRVAWAAMTDVVDSNDVRMLFGCSSFAGVDPDAYLDAFAMLKARHLGPLCWRPGVKAPDVFRFAAQLSQKPDAKKAMLGLPPLLRTYLLMGGWVSDHAVVDHQMNTLHVFTGLEIGSIPAPRKRILRALV